MIACDGPATSASRSPPLLGTDLLNTRPTCDAWWQVDLLEPMRIGRMVVIGYDGDTVETSRDGNRGDPVANRHITQTRNSAKPGRHLFVVRALEK